MLVLSMIVTVSSVGGGSASAKAKTSLAKTATSGTFAKRHAAHASGSASSRPSGGSNGASSISSSAKAPKLSLSATKSSSAGESAQVGHFDGRLTRLRRNLEDDLAKVESEMSKLLANVIGLQDDKEFGTGSEFLKSVKSLNNSSKSLKTLAKTAEYKIERSSNVAALSDIQSKLQNAHHFAQLIENLGKNLMNKETDFDVWIASLEKLEAVDELNDQIPSVLHRITLLKKTESLI